MKPKETTRAERIKSASTSRRQAKKEELRSAILEAALALFEEHGYEKFSLRQVAETVGYTPTTIYLYFANKDALLFQTAMEGFRTFGQRLQAAYDSSKDPRERFLHIGQAYIAFGLEHPVHYRLMFMQRGEFMELTPDNDCESVIDSFKVLQDSVLDCIKAGFLEEGEVETYANTAWAFVHGIVALAISVPSIDKAQVSKMQALFEHTFQEGFFKSAQ